MPEFILPPPHPSVKETPPRGGVSYDQIGKTALKVMKKIDEIQNVFEIRL